MRAGLFARWRREHGARLKRDKHLTSIDVSLSLRLSWASGDWLNSLQGVADFWADEASLQQWGVLPAAAGAGTAAVDSFLLKKVESLSRVFFGLQARALSLWSGGVYNLVLLCGTDEMEARAAVLRAQKLYYRVLALEALLMAKGNNAEIQAFGHDFIWRRGRVYAELMDLVACNRLDMATAYAWRCHCGLSHEKGSPGKLRHVICLVSCRAMSCHVLPYAMSCPVTPCHTMSNRYTMRVVPCHAIPSHAMSYRACVISFMQCRVVPCRLGGRCVTRCVMSCHVVSCCVALSHAMPCHAVSRRVHIVPQLHPIAISRVVYVMQCHAMWCEPSHAVSYLCHAPCHVT